VQATVRNPGNNPVNWDYADEDLYFDDNTDYDVIGLAKDNAGNASVVYTTHTFTYDTTEPLSGLISPNTDYYTVLNIVTGTASDPNINKSGVDYVKVGIELVAGGNTWWNGVDEFNAAERYDKAVYSGGQFTHDVSTVVWASGSEYIVYVKAVDKATNEQDPVTSWGFMYDAPSSSPTIGIEFPVDGSDYNEAAIAAIAGTSNDNESGVKRVEIILKDTQYNYYWNGASGWILQGNSGWNTWRVVTGTGSWSKGMPNLTDNYVYMVWARAVDNAGNYSAGQYADTDLQAEQGGEEFTYDNMVPETVIRYPLIAENDRDSLASISGTSTDHSIYSSGIDWIRVSLKRSDGKWLQGESWVDGEFPYSTNDGQTWYCNSISTSIYQDNEWYVVKVTAQDNAGNEAVVKYSTFTFDETLPTSGVGSIGEGDYVGNIGGCTGTANDANAKASGVEKVYISINQLSNDGGMGVILRQRQRNTGMWRRTQ
jgi:hypothetical protein